MSPKLRLWVLCAVGVVLALTVAWNVANESYGFASLCLLFALWLLAEWIHGPLPDAWVLAALLLGYILGNRGFAQWILTSWFPLLPAEAGLLLCAPALIVRMARREVPGVRRDPLNLAILAWMIVGTARMPIDFQRYGFTALRDYATIYYASFFFIAQAIARHRASVKLLRNTLLATGLILPLSYLVYSQMPEFFISRLQFRGIPLLFYKDDLVAAYLFAGFFLFQTVTAWTPLLRALAATVNYAVVFTIDSSRAALVALAVTCGWWALARRWAPWKLQAAIIPSAISLLALIAIFRAADISQSRLYSIYEHVASITDVSGTRQYESSEQEFVGDNNRFRLIWWRTVIDETWGGGRLFGLGFGYDLAAQFIKNYNLDMGDEFTARSPHSIYFTVLGRMGLVGLAAWLAVVAAIVARTWKAIRIVRHDDGALPVLGWWSVSWVMLMSASFGVVLEGPMGALVFWIALGVANQSSHELVASANDEVPAETPV